LKKGYKQHPFYGFVKILVVQIAASVETWRSQQKATNFEPQRLRHRGHMAAPCHPQGPDLGSFGEIIGVARPVAIFFLQRMEVTPKKAKNTEYVQYSP